MQITPIEGQGVDRMQTGYNTAWTQSIRVLLPTSIHDPLTYKKYIIKPSYKYVIIQLLQAVERFFKIATISL